MLQEVFYWIFNMSITAALTGLPAMLLRSIKKIPRRVAVFLWAIPFIRMAVPFGLNSPYNLMSLLARITTRTVVVYQPAEGVAFSMMNSAMAANSYFPITYKVELAEKVFGVASVIWIIVSLAIFLLLAVTYFTTIHEIRDATHLQENVYLSEKVASPAVYGIVRPRIVLPLSCKDQNNELVIAHEQAHIRGLDNLWRMLAFFLAAAHWFNPLCWLFLKGFLADLELCCDERVLAAVGPDRAKEYASTLLCSRQGATVFASAFGGAKIRTRIENILSFKKLTWLSLAAFGALLGGIF